MYANGTTHYNLPQTVGTDKRDWTDTNQAFADIDATLYTASETASSAASDITALGETVTTQGGDIADLKEGVSGLQTTVGEQGLAITGLGNKIDQVEDDALDMICAIDEGTAQVASVAVNEGEYFRYNNVLYMATANIAIGDTIVPNTNCRATNVATELQNGATPASVINDSTTGLDTTWSSSKINDEVSAVKTGDTRYNNGNLEYWDGTQWSVISIGGGSMECVLYGTATSGAECTVDLTSLGFTSANDYVVILDGYFVTSSGEYVGCVETKTATSFTITTSGSATAYNYSYQVLAKA